MINVLSMFGFVIVIEWLSHMEILTHTVAKTKETLILSCVHIK